MSRPHPKAQPLALHPPQPIPLALLVERGLVAAVAAMLAARPLIAGDDPGRLRLTSGGGPLSFNFCLFLLAAAAALWHFTHHRGRPSRGLLVPLLLAIVGAVAIASSVLPAAMLSSLPDRYARPSLFIGWEWIALGAGYFLVRQVGASTTDTRGLIHVFLATAVSIAGLGVYQSLIKPLGLPSTEVTAPAPPGSLVGDDEFYPELNRSPDLGRLPRGTLDSPETFLIFQFLALPLALAYARYRPRSPKGRWVFLVPGVLIAGILATLLSKPFADRGSWSKAFELLGRHPLFGIGPGNYSRLAEGSSPGAWPEWLATTGLLGLAALVIAVVFAIRQAWPRTVVAAHDPALTKSRWEFYVGGMFGLALGFIWSVGDVPAEAPAKEVLNLGTAAVYRAILWFASFAILEMVRVPPRALVQSAFVGIGCVLLFGFASISSGRPTLLFPTFGLLALAANLVCPAREATRSFDKPLRVASVLVPAVLGLTYLITAALPAWATANAVRQARMASRVFVEKHAEFERSRPGPGRANSLTSARGFLLANILNPLANAAERDPTNAALKLEIARWERPHWQYLLLADPEQAARLADKSRERAEMANQLDPHNLAAKRSLFEAMLLYRKNSKAREPERLAAMNKLIGQIAEREPQLEVPLRYRMVQMMLARGDLGVDVDIALLLKQDAEEGGPHGRITADQRQEVINQGLLHWLWWSRP
jgi:hypothetical protein